MVGGKLATGTEGQKSLLSSWQVA